MDLKADLARLARRRLKQFGFDDKGNDDLRTLLQRWSNVEQRVPSIRHWKVLESAELQARRPTLDASTLAGLDAFNKKATGGVDLKGHLSRKLVKAGDPDHTDPLLAEWGVQHFHLDVKVTRNLLFSFVHEETGTMYHLDIGEHNFVRQELVAILKRNWPDVLEPFEMKGIQFSGGYTDAEIGAFRKNGGNVAVPTGGDRAVAAIGGGLSTAGIGIQAVRFASWAIRMVADLEDRIRKQEQDLRKALGTGPTAELQFELVEFMPRIVVREQGTGKDVYNQPPQ